MTDTACVECSHWKFQQEVHFKYRTWMMHFMRSTISLQLSLRTVEEDKGTQQTPVIESLITELQRAVRIINGSEYRAHTNSIFIQLKIVKFNDLLEYSLLKIMCKAHLKTLTEILQNRFIKRVSNFNLRGTEVFQKPEFRTKLKERWFSIQGVSLWNNLNSEIKTSTSFFCF